MPAPNIERLQRSCEENIWTACLGLGREYQKRCDAGTAEACCQAAKYYDLARDERQRVPKLLAQGCDANAGACCAELGDRQLFHSEPGTEENARAAALIEKACNLGDLAGCERLALATANGEVGPPNRMRAIELAHTACKGGRHSSCELERAYYAQLTQ
jgi:TPR repeat protein